MQYKQKYCKWNLGETYDNSCFDHKLLSDERLLYFYSHEKLDFHTFTKMKCGISKVSGKMLEVLSCLSTGKGMTLHQLKNYLNLSGICNCSSRTEYLISKSLELGLISKTDIISNSNDPWIKDCIIVEYITLTDYGKHVLKRFYQRMEYSNVLINSVDREIDMIRKNIICNQIVQNTLVYEYIQFFSFYNRIPLNKRDYLDFPLYIKKDTGDYYFEIVAQNTWGKKKLLHKIKMISDELSDIENTTIILVGENRVHMKTIMQLCEKYRKRKGFNILFTHDQEWLTFDKGFIYKNDNEFYRYNAPIPIPMGCA